MEHETTQQVWTAEKEHIGLEVPKSYYAFLYEMSIVRGVSLSQVVRDLIRVAMDSDNVWAAQGLAKKEIESYAN